MPALSPIESEFASTEEAEAYDAWFRAKVQEALDDTRPDIPHDEVVARVKAKIAALRQAG
ncbi:type II toxin-antitoxin system RelB family antitoxin [Brevundimonas sp.]|uniref:type II toxin-antitoxin system RelB family antitoxin n=1 Tax=Brevundimonas sp. TaxID=1871086 RepID=UPI003D130B57